MEKGKITYSINDEGLGMNSDDFNKVFGDFAKLAPVKPEMKLQQAWVFR